MAGKGVVGKLSVKVVPDTDGFLRKLKKDLRKIKRAVGDLEIKVEAEVVLDKESLARVKRQLEGLDAEAKVRASLDKSSYARVKKQLEGLNPSIKPKVDQAGLKGLGARNSQVMVEVSRSSILRAKRLIEEVVKPRTVRISTKVDDSALRGFERTVERSTRSAKVNVRPKMDQAELAKLWAKAQENLRPTITIHDIEHAKAVNKARIAISEKMRKIDDVRIGVKAHVDGLQRMRAKIEKDLANIKAKVTLKDKRDAYRHQLEAALADIRVKLGLDPVSKRRIQREIKRLGGDVTINADLDKGKASLQLKKLTRPRFVEIIPRLNTAATAKVATALTALSGARALNNLRRSLTDLVSHLDETVLKFGALGSAAMTAVSGVGTLVGTAAQLGLALGRIAPALLVMPGLFAAVATGAGIFYAAVKDIKDVLGDLGPAFTDLQQGISGSFWSEAAGPIRDLVNTALPQLRENIVGIAQAYGQWAKAAAEVAKQKLGTIDDTLGNIKDASFRATRGIRSLTRGLITLVNVGSKYLPAMAEQFNKLADAFDKWVDKASQDGSIDKSIKAAVENAKVLWKIIKDVTGAIVGFAKGAEKGGFTLERMARGAENVNKAINGVRGQKVLENLFAGAAQGMDNFYRHLGKLGPEVEEFSRTARRSFGQAGEAAGVLAELFAKVMGSLDVQKGAAALFDGLIAGFDKIKQAHPEISAVFGEIGHLAGTLASTIGGVLAAAFINLGPAVVLLLEALGPLVVTLGDMLVVALEKAKPYLDGFAQWVRDANPETLILIAGAIGAIGLAFKAMGALEAATGLGSVLGVLTKIPPQVAIVIGIVALLAAGFIYLWNNSETFRNGVINAWNQIQQTAQTVTDWFNTNIAPALSKIWEDIKSGGRTVADWWNNEFYPEWQGLWNNIKEVWDRYGKPVFDWIVQKCSEVAGKWEYYWNRIKGIASGVWTAISGVIKGAVQIIKGILDIFLGLVDGDWKRVWNGIKSVFGGVWTALGSLARGGMQVLVNLFRGLGTTLWNLAKSAVQGLFNIWRGMNGTAFSIFRTLISGIGRVFSNAGSILLNAGKRIIDGFINGIKNGFNRVKSTLSNLTNLLPSWKGPAPKDSRILRPAGRLVIEGFDKGLHDSIPNVKKTLKSLTAQVSPDVEYGMNAEGTLHGNKGGGPTVNITNYYPQAQRDSATRDEVARGIALAGVVA